MIDIAPLAGRHQPGRRPAFAPPPFTADVAGRARRVGVELEFTGISARTAAFVLAEALGGTVEMLDPHAFRVRGTLLGDLTIELDLRYAHSWRRDPTLPFRPSARVGTALGWLLHGVVPRELVTGPLPLPRLPELDLAVAALRDGGAEGRGASLWGSLGLHFNIEPPRLDAVTLAGHLKAYLLLEPLLRRAVARRRWRPFLAAPFPAAYARRVVEPHYRPELPALMGDYLAANPTRNRGLDLLPILLYLDPERVRSVLPHAKISARPAFHLRLLQAYVSEPEWSIAGEWNRWVAVERLAADPDRLASLGSAYRDFRGSGSEWAAQLSPLLAAPA